MTILCMTWMVWWLVLVLPTVRKTPTSAIEMSLGKSTFEYGYMTTTGYIELLWEQTGHDITVKLNSHHVV